MLLTFYNAEDNRHHIELLAPDVPSAKGEKLMYKSGQGPVTFSDREGSSGTQGRWNRSMHLHGCVNMQNPIELNIYDLCKSNGHL